MEQACQAFLILLASSLAEVIAHAASSCQAPAVYGPEADATGKVVRSAPFQVKPEGLTRLHTESAYFCANGQSEFL